MPRPCTVCQHPQREDIDVDLVAGTTFRVIANRFGVGDSSVARHRRFHLSPALVAVHDGQQVQRHRDLLGILHDASEAIWGLVDAAIQQGHTAVSITALSEVRRQVELEARMTGELDERPVNQTVNVLVAPEWLATRGAIFEALAPFPEARAAVAHRLVALGEGAA
jgi:hypothetical protein